MNITQTGNDGYFGEFRIACNKVNSFRKRAKRGYFEEKFIAAKINLECHRGEGIKEKQWQASLDRNRWYYN